jgi:hypothetical protein
MVGGLVAVAAEVGRTVGVVVSVGCSVGELVDIDWVGDVVAACGVGASTTLDGSGPTRDEQNRQQYGGPAPEARAR